MANIPINRINNVALPKAMVMVSARRTAETASRCSVHWVATNRFRTARYCNMTRAASATIVIAAVPVTLLARRDLSDSRCIIRNAF
jgi:hypothetical protein